MNIETNLKLNGKMKKIITKFKKSSQRASTLSDEQLSEYAENLCDLESLKNAYLNTEFSAIKKLFTSMNQKNFEKELREGGGNGNSGNSKNSALKSDSSFAYGGNNTFSSGASKNQSQLLRKSTSTKDENNVDVNGNVIKDEVIEFENEFLEAEKYYQEKSARKFGNKIKIKLVIAEIAKTKRERTLRRLISPLMNTMDMSPQFGMFHSALIIGRKYLHIFLKLFFNIYYFFYSLVY
jgi:hypothetical protein